MGYYTTAKPNKTWHKAGYGITDFQRKTEQHIRAIMSYLLRQRTLASDSMCTSTCLMPLLQFPWKAFRTAAAICNYAIQEKVTCKKHMFLYGCRTAVVKHGQLIFFIHQNTLHLKFTKWKKNLEFKIKHRSKMLKWSTKVKVLVLKYWKSTQYLVEIHKVQGAAKQ